MGKLFSYFNAAVSPFDPHSAPTVNIAKRFQLQSKLANLHKIRNPTINWSFKFIEIHFKFQFRNGTILATFISTEQAHELSLLLTNAAGSDSGLQSKLASSYE